MTFGSACGTIWVLGIELGSDRCKASDQTAVLSLPSSLVFLNVCFLLVRNRFCNKCSEIRAKHEEQL